MSDLFPDNDDRCVDPLDQASKVEQKMREADLAAARARSAPEQEQVKDENGNLYWPITECVDCGDDIPPARLQLARIRCVYCQEKLEKGNRLHGRH